MRVSSTSSYEPCSADISGIPRTVSRTNTYALTSARDAPMDKREMRSLKNTGREMDSLKNAEREMDSLKNTECTCALKPSDVEMNNIYSLSPPEFALVCAKEGKSSQMKNLEETQGRLRREELKRRKYVRQTSRMSLANSLQCVFGCLLACHRRR